MAQKTLKKIIQNGLIEKVVDKKDERKYQLKITQSGIELLESTKNIVDNVDQLTFKGFNDEELIEFNNYLERIINNLETDYSRNKKPYELLINIKEGRND